jgi:hypothetical protein
MGALFFLVALLTWEIVALFMMSSSLSAFLGSLGLGDPRIASQAMLAIGLAFLIVVIGLESLVRSMISRRRDRGAKTI